MLGGEKAAVAFHGDHRPVSVYVDGQAITEPAESTKSGASVEFEGTYNDSAEVSVAGRSEQVQLTGIQLFDLSDGVTGQINPEFSVDSDGWISIEIDNTSGTYTEYRNYWTNKSDNLATNTSYKIVLEVAEYEHVGANASGINVHSQNNGASGGNVQFSGNRTFNNLWCKAGAVLVEEATTINDFSNINSMMRSFAYANAGSYMKARFRLSCVPASTNTDADSFVYEPYCGGIPSPNPDYPQPIESIKSVDLVSRNDDSSKSATRTIDLQGHELRSLPDGTHDEVVVHRDGTVELVQRCDASMFDPSYPVSNEWKLAAPQTIQLPSIDPLPTFHPHTFVDGNGADIRARVRVMP